jgi:hypothetical protein
MLVVAAVLLYAPFVYATHRLNLSRRVPSERATEIARSNCAELRRTRLDVDALESFIGGPGAPRAEQERRLIEQRSQQLKCRPPIDPRWAD